jgi:hypothetical protein
MRGPLCEHAFWSGLKEVAMERFPVEISKGGFKGFELFALVVDGRVDLRVKLTMAPSANAMALVHARLVGAAELDELRRRAQAWADENIVRQA